MEQWKPVVGYEQYYLVSNTGKVKSIDKWVDIGLGRKQFKPERILRQAKGSHGYMAVHLCFIGKQVSTLIHSIIAKAWIDNPHNYRCVNHKDGNKLNNSIDNLEWCCHSQNTKHAYDTGLKKPCRKVSSEEVVIIRSLYKNFHINTIQLSAMYAVKRSTISQIVNFKSRLNG